jgi:hypothetical protein
MIDEDADIAIVCVNQFENTGAVQSARGVTIGGQAATFLAGQTRTANPVVRTELWYKLSPLTGEQTVAATGHATTDKMVTGVMSFKGVAQASTFNGSGTTAEGDSRNADVDSIASAVGEMGVLCGAAQQGGVDLSVAPDGGAPASTEQFDLRQSAGGASILGFGYTEDGAVTSIAMRVNLSASVNWAAEAVSLRPAD